MLIALLFVSSVSKSVTISSDASWKTTTFDTETEYIVTISRNVQSIPSNVFYNVKLSKITFASNSKLEAINESAFKQVVGLKSIVLPEGLKSIGETAFYMAKSLQNVTIPSSCTSIQAKAFSDCTYLVDVFIKYGTESLSYGSNIFSNTKITSYSFSGAKLSIIPVGMFSGCSSLYSITMPDEITIISESAFKGCEELYVVNSYSGLKMNGVEEIRAEAFSGCSSLENIKISGTDILIDENAFYNCENLETVTITSAKCRLMNYVFYLCKKLNSFTAPESIQYFGTGVFKSTPKLTKLDLPIVTEFGNNALGYCGITSFTLNQRFSFTCQGFFYSCSNLLKVTFAKGIDSIPKNTFIECQKLKEIIFNSEISLIGETAFKNCYALETLKLDGVISSIGISAFESCKSLKTIEFSSPIKSAPYALFRNCEKLQTITPGFDNTVLAFGDNLFYNCQSLESTYFPSKLTSIGSYCFQYTNIKEIIVPDTVTSIGSMAFDSIPSLETLYIPETVIQSNFKDLFSNCPKLANLTYLPNNLGNITAELGDFLAGNTHFAIKHLVLPSGTKSFYQLCFDSSTLVSVNIPKRCVMIEDKAFHNCQNLTTVNIESTELLVISYYGFANCGKLQSVTFPANVYEVRSNAFNGCKGLQFVDFNHSFLMLESWAFGNSDVSDFRNTENVFLKNKAFSSQPCIKSFVIGGNNVYLENDVFNSAPKLEEVTLNEGIMRIKGGAFYGCKSLRAIILPSTVTVLEGSAFRSCTSVSTLKLNEGLTEIQTWALDNINITVAEIPSTVTTLGESPITSPILSEFIVSVQNKKFSSVNGILMNKEETEIITVPPKISEINIPDSVVTIRASASVTCVFETLKIGKNVKYIGNYAFSSCFSLREVIFGTKLEQINEGIFYLCSSLERIELPPSLNSIGTKSFGGCTSLEYVSIAKGTMSIANGVFIDSPNIKQIDFFKVKAAIGDLSIPKSIEKVTFDGGDITFTYHTFKSTNLNTLIVSRTSMIIIADTFGNCTKLNTVKLSGNIQMKANAFADSLAQEISLLGTTEIILDEGSFNKTKTTKLIYCGSNTYETKIFSDDTFPELLVQNDYEHQNSWGLTAKRNDLKQCREPSKMQLMSSNPYQYSVTTGGTAFFGDGTSEHSNALMKPLNTLDLPNKFGELPVIGILQSAFELSIATTATIPRSIGMIESKAFASAHSLKTVTFEDESELTTIGNKAFFETAIEEIVIPNGTVSIGNDAFASCSKLTRVTYCGDIAITGNIFNGAPDTIEITVGPHYPSVTFGGRLVTVDKEKCPGEAVIIPTQAIITQPLPKKEVKKSFLPIYAFVPWIAKSLF